MKKGRYKNVFIIGVFFLVGVFMAVAVKNIATRNIPAQREFFNAKTLYNQDLMADNLKNKNAELENKIASEQEHLRMHQDAEASLASGGQEGSDNLEAYLDEKIESYQIFDGSIPIEGPGVRITLSDSDKVVEAGENPNKYLVHNSDILAVINELKAAGAEGIQINNIRLTSKSNIDCGGAVINVDDEISSHPFVIEAVGDADSMYTYLNSEESVIQLLKYWEIKVNIEKSEYLLLNKSNKL
ncbi:MAG: DUF881 domain-containing protein [Eubacterium sp.]|nr:DUF881 domain-containing protein [Eubacterium sp.]